VLGAATGHVAIAPWAPHMALGIREAMRRAVGAEPAGLGQGAGIAAVGLDLTGAGGLHGSEVRVGDDDLVAEVLEAAGDPFALVEASIRTHARGRGPSTAPKRSGSVRMRGSTTSPPSARM